MDVQCSNNHDAESVADYYNQTSRKRLRQRAFLLEGLWTQELIQCHAPAALATVFSSGNN